MAKPLYYVERSGSWRSLRPEVWLTYIEEMLEHLKCGAVAPVFEEYGKAVYGRPSRVKKSLGPHEKVVYWTEEDHLLVRTPDGWGVEDWEFERLDASRRCAPEDAPPGPDIFQLLSQS